MIGVNLYKEILFKLLENEEVHITFPNLTVNIAEIVELECYKALQNIKAVIEDDGLEDRDCFMKVERIVAEFERLGSSGGSRHDF